MSKMADLIDSTCLRHEYAEYMMIAYGQYSQIMCVYFMFLHFIFLLFKRTCSSLAIFSAFFHTYISFQLNISEHQV